MKLNDGVTTAAYLLVPRELPHAVLGEAAIAGVFETGNPKHGWDHLLAKVGVNEPTVLQELGGWMEHCVSAAEEGVDYACPRAVLDALTTLHLMEKCGRGRWRPTAAGEAIAAFHHAREASRNAV